jgi:Ca2+-transporting ATPase
MIIDPVCSVVFEAEAEERNIMHRPPRDPATPILTGARLVWCGLQGAIAFVVVAVVFVTAMEWGLPEREVRSVVFACLVTTNVALIFVNRSFGGTSMEVLTRPNRLLWFALVTVAGVVSLLLAWTPARELFRFGPMHGHDVGICLVAGALLFLTLQILKGFWKVRLQA